METWRAILESSQGAMATSFGAAFMLTEGVKLAMVLAHGVKQLIDKWFEKKEREEREKEAKARKEERERERQALAVARQRERIARERERQAISKARAEGQAKANQAWEEWLARKEDAESRGEPFTEPPPNGKTP